MRLTGDYEGKTKKGKRSTVKAKVRFFLNDPRTTTIRFYGVKPTRPVLELPSFVANEAWTNDAGPFSGMLYGQFGLQGVQADPPVRYITENPTDNYNPLHFCGTAAQWAGQLSTDNPADVGPPDCCGPQAILEGDVRMESLVQGSVATGYLLPGSVRMESLVQGSVNGGYLIHGSVFMQSLIQGSETSGYLLPGSVRMESLVQGSETTGYLLPGSILTETLVHGTATGGGGLTLSALDRFQGTPNTTMVGRVPDAGPNWSVASGTWTAGGGQAQEAASDAVNHYVTQPVALADGTFGVVYTVPSTVKFAGGLVMRFQDANNLIWATIENDTTSLATAYVGMVKRVGGVQTSLGSAALSVTLGSSYQLTVVLSGTNATVYVNGVSMFTISTAPTGLGTNAGLITYQDVSYGQGTFRCYNVSNP